MTFPLAMMALGFFLSGLCTGNALAATDAGRSPLWSAMAAVGALLFALAWLPRLRRTDTGSRALAGR